MQGISNLHFFQAHPIQHEGKDMYRFQGVALPKGIFLNHVAFGILEKRAAKLVRMSSLFLLYIFYLNGYFGKYL